MIGLRDAQLPPDAEAILQIDTSFSTNAIYIVATEAPPESRSEKLNWPFHSPNGFPSTN